MNIQQAKEEIIRTVRIYTAKDESGNYRIPPVHQRPVLLIGPPGIGKTAVIRQAAEACGVGLVAYTITHHTRQSAVGLPVIREKEYQGQKVQVTEYTMSEIIASVYECMEKEQVREGILFIDEINCVSETLAPTMLQFLQNKTFGTHRVPRGWVIVAAGNPPEYNKSAKNFDIVTLDRVKSIRVEIDFPAWKAYAARQGLHGAILSYLAVRPQDFYYIEQGRGEREFVTARGWEDLSVLLDAYEREQIPAGEDVIREYLHCRRIAADFAAFYRLYLRYRKEYDPGRILRGDLSGEELRRQKELFDRAGADERYSVMQMLLSGLCGAFHSWEEKQRRQERRRELYRQLRGIPSSGEKRAAEALEEFLSAGEHALAVKDAHRLITEEELQREEAVLRDYREQACLLKSRRAEDWKTAGSLLEQWLDREDGAAEETAREAGRMLDRAIAFLEDTAGDGPEMGYFITALTQMGPAASFLSACTNEAYGRHLGALAVTGEEEELKRQILEAEKAGEQ